MYKHNQNKIVVTKEEYEQMQKLIKIINNRTFSTPRRKIAKARYESMLRFIKNRPVSRKFSNSAS